MASTRRGSKSKVKKETAVFDKDGNTDNISRYLDARKLVPERFRGTDDFLDVVSWNIRWFDSKDPERVKGIAEVLAAINADVLVLTEIATDGALDTVVDKLATKKAGYYTVKCGATGSQQRIVLMWDRDWVRSKEDPTELFAADNLVVPAEFGPGKQRVFPRLPLWGYFEALAAEPGKEGFAFELAGVHLKAQGPAPKGYKGQAKRWGIPQRTRASERLATWLEDAEQHFDADVLVIGDWNATAGEEEWSTLRKLEAAGGVVFEKINPAGEVSHLVRLNAGGGAGSRIDLHLISSSADAQAVPDQTGVVIRWQLFDDLDVLAGAQRRDLFKRLMQNFSDHLPVVSRFYLTPPV